MSIIATCACGKKFRAANEHAGKTSKCPACGQPTPVPEATRSPVFARARPLPHARSVPHPGMTARRRRSPEGAGPALAIASLVLGGVALFFIYCLPVGGGYMCLSWPLSAIGLVLGLVALALILTRHASGIGLAIAGIAVCLWVCLALSHGLSTGLDLLGQFWEETWQ